MWRAGSWLLKELLLALNVLLTHFPFLQQKTSHKMWLHLPSAFVGSVFAGSGFLLIHRELSHRRRLTTKWEIQEYAEAQWKEIRKGAGESAASSSKVRGIDVKCRVDSVPVLQLSPTQLNSVFDLQEHYGFQQQSNAHR